MGRFLAIDEGRARPVSSLIRLRAMSASLPGVLLGLGTAMASSHRMERVCFAISLLGASCDLEHSACRAVLAWMTCARGPSIGWQNQGVHCLLCNLPGTSQSLILPLIIISGDMTDGQFWLA